MTAPVVLITGALAGIGRATAKAFAEDGYRVVVSGRREAEGEALAQELRADGAEAHFIRADVRNEDEVKALVDGAVARFGRLDVAVNNAGTEGQPGALVDHTPERYAATFDTNVLGVLNSLKHELRVLQAQGSGAIVNVSSVVGKLGFAGAGVYAASKFAVEGLTKVAALEAAPFGVRVNAVAPGPIDTAMIDRFVGSEDNKKAFGASLPLGRLGRPEEIARTIVFLASPAAGFITGESISADGGRLAG